MQRQQELLKRLREPRIAAVVGIAIAIVVVGLFLLLSGDDNGGESSPAGPAPTNGFQATSEQGLRDLAGSVDHPVYWVGARAGMQYQMQIAQQGNIQIRYVDPKIPANAQSVASLTIGTYPVANAYTNTKALGNESGVKTGETPDGGFVVTSPDRPQSVYIAFPGKDQQIEVYDPDPKTAFSLATSGAVVPIS